MIISDACISQLTSPVRTIKARVELLEGSTLLNQFCYKDALISFDVQRVGEGKFFGFGICQRLNVHLRDPHRELNISTANSLDISFGAGCEYIYPLPVFHVSEVHRDENTNELSITAYDVLYKATEHLVSELELSSYTIREFATACAALLGLPLHLITQNEAVFDTYYPNGANFEGTETIRDALNDIAEATQTIYYIDDNWNLTFKQLDMNGEPVVEIDKEKYFSLKSGDNRRLAIVCNTTELGDAVSASAEFMGSTQFVRDNAFWELRDDIATIVDNALAAVSGLTIAQFDCSWRGNFLVEIGDKIAITTKDNETIYSYLLNDTIEYNGSYSQKTEWKYDENEGETAANPTTLGDALKQTYAKVDKVNKQIDIVASDISAKGEEISQLQITTGSIATSVSQLQSNTNGELEYINASLVELNSKLEQTAEDVTISINKIAKDGVSGVTTTSNKYTFDDKGLHIAKSGSEMETKITEDGMTVYKKNREVLTANNEGVKAIDLHATTFLIIGDNSRLEDYPGKKRTACFWIGG